MRDPRHDPQVGDVVVIVRVPPWGGDPIEHHLGVTGRTQRKVEFLNGDWSESYGGRRGGSPETWPLAVWRAETAAGRATVRAEDQSAKPGWDAIAVSWRLSG